MSFVSASFSHTSNPFLFLRRSGIINPVTSTTSLQNQRTDPEDYVAEIIPSIKGVWEEFLYKIKVNWASIRSTQATLIKGQNKITCPVVWHFPLLSQERLKEALRTYDSPFRVIIKEEKGLTEPNLAAAFTAHVYCDELKNEAKAYWKQWNSESLVHKKTLISWEADWCRMEPDREERQRFFLRKLLKSQQICFQENYSNYPPGPIHAVMILHESGFSFDGMHLEGIKIPGAKVPEVIFRNAYLEEADLRDVHVEQGDFYRTSLQTCRLAGAYFGLRLAQKLNTSGIHFSLSQDDRWLIYANEKFTVQEDAKKRIKQSSRQIMFFELENGTMSSQKVLKGQKDAVKSAQLASLANYSDFSSGRRWFAYWNPNKIQIVSMDSFEIVGSINCKKKCIMHLVISPDESTLAAVDLQGGLLVWQMRCSKKALKFVELSKQFSFINDPVKKICFLGDGAAILLAVWIQDPAGRDILKVIDINKRETISQWASEVPLRDMQAVFDSSILLIRTNNTLAFWRFRTNELEPLITSQELIEQAACSSNGRNLFYSTGQFITQFDLKERHEIIKFEATKSLITCLCCNSKGDQLFVMDNAGGIKSWEIDNLPHPNSTLGRRIITASFAPDGQQLLLMNQTQLQAYDVSTGRILSREPLPDPQFMTHIQEHFKSAQDLIRFIQGKPDIYVRFLIEKVNRTFTDAHASLPVPFNVCSVTDDLAYLAFGTHAFDKNRGQKLQSTIEIWDVRHQKKISEWAIAPIPLPKEYKDTGSLASAIDPRFLTEGISRIAVQHVPFDNRLNVSVLTYKEGLSVWQVGLKDGSIMKASENQSDISFLLEFKNQHRFDMFFSDRHALIYFISRGAGTIYESNICRIKIWDYQQNKWLKRNRNSHYQADVLCLHDHLSLCVTDDKDSGIHFWNLLTGEELLKIEEEGSFEQILLSPDGNYLSAIREGGSSIYLWKLNYENKKMGARLLWRIPSYLNFHKATIHPSGVIPPAHDLNQRHRRLLKQLGAEEKSE